MAVAAAAAASSAPANILGAASAQIRTPDGTVVGSALIPIRSGVIVVRIAASGMRPGRYAVHLHAVGRCDGPAFESAGPHWNPTARQHGRLNPQGHHLGDLPNLDIGANRTGRLEFTIPGTGGWDGAHPLFDADGASIVIHAGPDDYRTDPSGNSGGRVACGILNY
ncbi:MAG TPA: superoxide dismutase family protein [Allosphingosinicella sp.]|nr:superoxide dismutase family protein [Allosphingosinicella sp.]